jgi:hypothetical protein
MTSRAVLREDRANVLVELNPRRECLVFVSGRDIQGAEADAEHGDLSSGIENPYVGRAGLFDHKFVGQLSKPESHR